MGSTPDQNYNSGAMPPQGPSIEELQPAQPPPSYTSFLPGLAGQSANGLTPAMMRSIAGGMSASPAMQRPAAPAAAAGPSRDDLAAMMAMTSLRDRKRQDLSGKGGRQASWGPQQIEHYLDTNYAMPKPMAAPQMANVGPPRGRM